MTTHIRHFTIVSTHATLAEAVAASGVDLSYNPEHAASVIRDADAPCKRAQDVGIGATERAWVVREGADVRVLHSYTARGLRMLKVFSPFASVMHDGDLVLFRLTMCGTTIEDTAIAFPNDVQGRQVLRPLLRGFADWFVLV